MSSAPPNADAPPQAETAAAASSVKANVRSEQFDPEHFRMTIGEHLEELRKRLFLGVAGFLVFFVVFMIFGEDVVVAFCRPLVIALQRNKLPPSIYFTEAAESFMTYIKISMISAGAFAAPWAVYQLWLFIAAGLYPKERKYITKYLPLSIFLLISGMVFLYFYVLPLMLEFFLKFNMGSAFTMRNPWPVPPSVNASPLVIPMVDGDPKLPTIGELWFNIRTGFLKIHIADGENRVLNFGSESLVTPLITLGQYIDMVVGMLLAFGLSFQLPLVVLSLNKIGIMEIATLKKARRIVYFSLCVIAAFVVPDVATGMIALLVPLILLYELGILLCKWSLRKAAEEESTSGTTSA